MLKNTKPAHLTMANWLKIREESYKTNISMHRILNRRVEESYKKDDNPIRSESIQTKDKDFSLDYEL